ncbi:MAG: beta-ketoacyl-ACP synthase [Sinobacteraceae bacterium]|nr:beta-ketoacyl-ACP synthase [Nevskiaceae bacterium]
MNARHFEPPAITAFTATSALGRGLEAHARALREERSGLRRQAFEDCTLDTWIGAVDGLEIPLPPQWSDWDCRNHRLAELGLNQDGFVAAVERARARYGAQRVGVFIGTSTSGVRETERAYRELREDRLPDWFQHRTMQNTYAVADYVRRRLALCGPSAAISTACSSSAKVFAAAARALGAGLCDAAVVGGVDSLCLTTLYGFHSLQLLARDICRPADAERSGLSLGEAAAFLLLEREAGDARWRLEGYGESSDAHHMSAPDPEGRGALAAMRAALARARIAPQEVDYINLHGTGTPANDLAEDRAVCALFGRDVPCSSTKGWTGHTLGAAGALEAALSLLALREGFLPRSLNTRRKDPRIEGAILMSTRRAPLRRVLSNSFGFGGSNCSLLLGVRA